MLIVLPLTCRQAFRSERAKALRHYIAQWYFFLTTRDQIVYSAE